MTIRQLHRLLFSFVLLLVIGCTPKDHTATTQIQLMRADISGPRLVPDNAIRPQEDLTTEMAIIKSHSMSRKVAERLDQQTLTDAFMRTYNAGATESDVIEKLKNNLTVKHQPNSLILMVSYAHPEPKIAVKVADLFAEAYIEYTLKLNIDGGMQVIEDLRMRADKQQDRVEAVQADIDSFIEQHDGNTPAGDNEADRTTLRALNEKRKQAKLHLESLSEDQTEEITIAQKSQLQATEAVKKQEAVLIEKSAAFIQYHSLLRELEVQKNFLKALRERMAQESTAITLKQPKARIVQPAEIK